jgi:hypothetical protein
VVANRGFSSRLACVKDWNIVGSAMEQSKPVRKGKRLKSSVDPERRVRQSATLRKTLATREARARMSAAAKKSWTPERKARASAAIKKSWTVRRTRDRRITGIKKAWTPVRREVQGTRMSDIMADPVLNARRLAALDASNRDPVVIARKLAALRKADARPGARARRIRNLKKTTSSREARARRSVRLKKMWADFYSGRAELAATARPRNRRGRPSMDDKNRSALTLRERGESWTSIARKLYPEAFTKDRDAERAATERVRSAVRRMRRSNKQIGDSSR